jgi:hypothetical protein
MGHWIECDKCKKTYRYDSDEIEDTGTGWYPIWTVKCHGCGNQIDFEVYKDKFSENDLKIKEMAPRKSGRERAESGDIREYWIQEYVKDNHAKLGFSKMEGPFDVGPDFKGVYKGKRVIVEAERDCQSFIQHKHYEDERFKEVSILIVLNPSKPPKEIKDKLPKTIIYINIDDFVEWWRPKARAYAKTKRIQGILDLIAGEFQKRFVKDCGDKDRDMSTCPECDLCPYFGEGTAYEASSIFHEMALKFIALYEYSITSDNFKLTDIEPSKIDMFYFDFFTSVEQTIDYSNCCPYCKPNLEEGRYFLPDGSSLPFYVDEKGVIHNPDCPKIKKEL